MTAMPSKYRPMVLLASWCGLRFGELAELRRGDIDVKNGVIHIRRAVVHVDGSHRRHAEVGRRHRDVAIPPHLMPMVKDTCGTTSLAVRTGCCSPPPTERAPGHLDALQVVLQGP